MPGPIAQASGLVNFYQYALLAQGYADPEDFDIVPANARVQLIAEGAKKGTEGQKLYSRQIFRNDDRPTEVLCEVEFTAPRTTPLGTSEKPSYTTQSPEPDIRATHFVTTVDADADIPTTEQRASSRMVIGPPRQVRPGSDWYYPVEWEYYDGDGNSKWAAVGQVTDPSDPGGSSAGPYESITLTYYHRDSKGRSLHTVMDAEPDASVPLPSGYSTGGGFVTIPQEAPLGRVSTEPALNYMTSFKYDKNGLSDVFYPSGRRWARRVIELPHPENPGEKFAREYIFNNLEDDGTGQFTALSPGEVRDHSGVEPIGTGRINRRVEFTSSIALDSIAPGSEPTWQEMWQVEVAPDANGRLQNVSLLERDPTGAMLAVGSKEVNDLGEVHREREIDGTITRRTKDSVGQVLRTYIGTEDLDWPDYPTNPSFNMILTERFEYGTGINDAWMPISVRTYDSMPGWHRSLGSHTHSGGGDPVGYYDDPPDIDPDGVATITRPKTSEDFFAARR